MARSIVRRALLVGVAACHLVLSLVTTSPSIAQDIDREPPTITYEPLEQGRRGDRQVFSATVTDDVGVESVTLRYRPAGSIAYTSVPMELLPGTDIRTASIDELGAEVSAIEYYIEARDTAGNRSIEGFAFEPLERRLVEPAAPLADGASGEPGAIATGGLSTGQKILYGVLGVIAIGALAAAASGGGGDGGGGNDVEVRIVTPQLQP